MRYLNWDVLLFATESDTKAPLQEYRTQCGVTDDPTMLHPTKTPFQMEQSYIPLVTSFVASLPEGSGFKVSVHSWTPPVPSTICQSMMLDGDSAWFEARVYVDGRFISGSLYNDLTTWPQPIDESNWRDRYGNVDKLRFPAFHEEVLTQKNWLATETKGRIRVIIAEGICRRHGLHTMVPVKDVIGFAFQHAPQNVLESAGIAWPCPSMWHPVSRRLLSGHKSSGNPYMYHWDADSHTHFSPNPPPVGPGASLIDAQYTYQRGFNAGMMGPPAFTIARARHNHQSITMEDADLFGASGPSMPMTRIDRGSVSMEDADPFLEVPTSLPSRRDYLQSSNEDVAMMSRSASGRTRVPSDMSGISFEQRAPVIEEPDLRGISLEHRAPIIEEPDLSGVHYDEPALFMDKPAISDNQAPFARGRETFGEYLLRVSPVHAPMMGIPAQAEPGPSTQGGETFEAFLRRVSPPKAPTPAKLGCSAQSETTFAGLLRRGSPPTAPPMGIWQHGKATGELLTGTDLETPRSIPKQSPTISPYLSMRGLASGYMPTGDVKGRKEGKTPEVTDDSQIESLATSTNRGTSSLIQKANGTLGPLSSGKRKLSWTLLEGKENESGPTLSERKALKVRVSETGSPEPEEEDEDDEEFEDEETEALKEALAVVGWEESDGV